MLEDLKPQVLTNIVAFTRVVETRSFTAAARQFGMSKATVSKQVSMLEVRIGVRLLNRTTRTLSLTSAGSGFYAHCRHIVAELNAAMEPLTITAVERLIRVSSSTSRVRR